VRHLGRESHNQKYSAYMIHQAPEFVVRTKWNGGGPQTRVREIQKPRSQNQVIRMTMKHPVVNIREFYHAPLVPCKPYIFA
jgi:hypothetical protein